MSKEVKSFQTETKQLLHMMIHSIYTHRDIFLRELISNASDAIDKIKFKSLTNQDLLEGNANFEITIKQDKDTKILTISDSGIGMTYDEVVQNLGTIAKSGSKAFMDQMKENKESSEDVEIIGQFGVGFYSAFMIGKKVTVITKSPEYSTGVKWESEGDGNYSIEEYPKENRGTDIIIELRENEESINYEEYLTEFKIQELIKKYSDYIRYPIKMDFITEEKPTDEEGNEIENAPTETKIENKILNSMTPLWKKDKSAISDEEYNDFYKSKFHDWTDPAKVIHTKAEGSIEYTALLFIPSKAPMDFYSKEFNKGVQLYSKNVFIMENCQEILPDYFRFAKGLIDSTDFTLNLSREVLQQNRQLKIIAKNIEKKIKSALLEMLEKDKENYVSFWKEFGATIKAGIYEGFGANKEKLQDLLIFENSASTEMTTLSEYVKRMKEGQKEIYFASGETRTYIENLPQMEVIKDKGYEVLYFLDKVDEFAIQGMRDFDGKTFKSITQGNLDLGDETEEEKKETKEKEENNKDLLVKMKELLKDKVTEVKLTNRLKSSAVCLVSGDNGITFEMEKVMADMPGAPMAMKATRILEINPKHKLFETLKDIYTQDKDSSKLKSYSDLLYSQALLMEGFKLDDPVAFANQLSALMAEAKF